MTWIKLTSKKRMITELRWRMHCVAFHSMTALEEYTRNRLSSNGNMSFAWERDWDELQCKAMHPLKGEQTDAIFFASAGHENSSIYTRLTQHWNGSVYKDTKESPRLRRRCRCNTWSLTRYRVRCNGSTQIYHPLRPPFGTQVPLPDEESKVELRGPP